MSRECVWKEEKMRGGNDSFWDENEEEIKNWQDVGLHERIGQIRLDSALALKTTLRPQRRSKQLWQRTTDGWIIRAREKEMER